MGRSSADGSPAEVPDGTVSFVLTDVESSTVRWQAEPDAMARAMERHTELLISAFAARGGVCPPAQGEGDSVVATFRRPSDALLAARDAQRLLAAEPWPTTTPLRVRMAVHTGEALVLQDGNYAGHAIIRCARLRDIAHGGQVLVSAPARDVVVDALGGDVELRDLGEHRLRDLTRPERVYQLVDPANGQPDRFPPLRSLDPHRQNLPVPLSSFVGRVAETGAVAALLGGHRLVTVTGPGGAGKTRLALQVAANAVGQYPDGVWWVPLADVRQAHGVGEAVAAALAVHVDTTEDAVASLAARVGGRHMLLVLDNCEHVVDAVAALVDVVLQRTPRVSLLVTSREALALDGEIWWRIPRLGLTGDDAASDAVQLFVERAMRSRPELRIEADDVAVVAAICERLDGIPLAIELAAARCRSLTLAQIADGLDDVFALLTGGGRGRLARQQTLEGSIDWSHALLTEREKVLLRRLSVFAGGCTLHDVLGVVADDQLPAGAIVDLLDRLVAQSIIALDDGRSGRYVLLEVVRQYAARRLTEAGEEDVLARRHAEHFLALASNEGPRLEGRDDVAALARLAAEIDNLRRAGETFDSTRRWSDHAVLIAATQRLWEIAAAADAARALGKVLDGLGPVPSEVRTRALIARARAYLALADFPSAVVDAMTAVQEADTPQLRARAGFEVAAMIGFGDMNTAEGIFTQALADAREAGDAHAEAEILVLWSMGYLGFTGAMARGWALVEEAEPIVDRSGDHILLATRDAQIAIGHVLQGDFRGARAKVAAAEEALRAVTDATGTDFRRVARSFNVGSPIEFGRIFATLALEGAEANLDASERVMAEAEADGMPGLPVFVGPMLGIGQAAKGDLAGARRRLTDGAARAEALMATSWAGTCRILAAECARQLGDVAGAEADLAHVEAFGLERVAFFTQARALTTRGAIALGKGEAGEAERLAHEALAIAYEHHYLWELVVTFELLLRIAAANESWVEVARCAGIASALREGSGFVLDFEGTGAACERACAAASDALGPPAFDAAVDDAKVMSLDSAVELVRRSRGTRGRPKFGWDALTPTELAVVDRIASGMTNAAIAEALFMSLPTVKTHLHNIFTKVGISRRAELTALALRRGRGRS